MDDKDEKGLVSRVEAALPAVLGVGTGLRAYSNPQLFDPYVISRRFSPTSTRGRAISALLGASLGTGIGALPGTVHQAFKSASQRVTAAARRRFVEDKLAEDLFTGNQRDPTKLTFGTGIPAVPKPLPPLEKVDSSKQPGGMKRIFKSNPKPGSVNAALSSKLVKPQRKTDKDKPEVGKATSRDLA